MPTNAIFLLGQLSEAIAELEKHNERQPNYYVRQIVRRLKTLLTELVEAVRDSEEPECTACGYVRCRCSIPWTYGV